MPQTLQYSYSRYMLFILLLFFWNSNDIIRFGNIRTSSVSAFSTTTITTTVSAITTTTTTVQAVSLQKRISSSTTLVTFFRQQKKPTYYINNIPRGGAEEVVVVEEKESFNTDSTTRQSVNDDNDSITERMATSTTNTNTVTSSNNNDQQSSISKKMLLIVPSYISTFGKLYGSWLEQRPIITKSITAGCIFALSDYIGQKLEKKNDVEKENVVKVNMTRILSSAAVGLFYFGPAAHYWYNMIFQLLPSTTLLSTLQKAILGQIFFGPTFTCIFFATGLIQSNTFTINNWINKIRNDLPTVWLSGAGYWPIVDLISYSYIQPQYIPLFVNICSLIWTTYLVIKSYS